MMRILVAIDDSKYSQAAANAVISNIRPDGTEVTLLHVLDPFPRAVAAAMGSKEMPDFVTARMKLRDQAEAFLAQIAEQFRIAKFAVSQVLAEGDPRDIILDCAEQLPADLIVLGSHGRTGMTRLFMGSVSEAVARHARCSVQIVRIRPAAEAG